MQSDAYNRDERIAEVKSMVDAYAEMGAHLSNGDMIISMAMSAWLTATMGALIKWGVLTYEEHQILMSQIKAEMEQQAEQIKEIEAEQPQIDDDPVLVLIKTQGI